MAKPEPKTVDFPSLRKKKGVKNYGLITGTSGTIKKDFKVKIVSKKSSLEWNGVIVDAVGTGGTTWLARVEWKESKKEEKRALETLTVTVTNLDPTPDSGQVTSTDDTDIVE